MKGNLQSRLEKLEARHAPPSERIAFAERQDGESDDDAIERAWALRERTGEPQPDCWVAMSALDELL